MIKKQWYIIFIKSIINHKALKIKTLKCKALRIKYIFD
jgi:hypothetical protein